MKKLFLCAFLALAVQGAKAQDWSKFQYQGKVLKAEVRTSGKEDVGVFGFDSEGQLTTLSAETAIGFGVFRENFQATKNGYVGRDGNLSIDVVMKQGKVTTVNFTAGDRKYNNTYSYGSDGFLSKIAESVSWTTTSEEYVERKDKIDDNGVQKLLEQIRKEKDPARKAKLQKQYQAAVSGAKVNTSGGYTRKLTHQHSENYSRTYYDYQTDEFGNWTSRRFRDQNGDEYTQTQTITYDPDFLSNYRWEQLKLQGSLNDIADFALASETTDTYKQQAARYWNERILAEAGNDMDKLCAAGFSGVATAETRDKALSIVRSTIYNEQIAGETDYKKVASFVDKKWKGHDIFDEAYKSRIQARSNELRADVLAGMQQQLQTAFDAGQYDDAIGWAGKMLEHDAQHTFAKEMKAEAGHRILLAKEAAKTITCADYEGYVKTNPDSKYRNECEDKWALLFTDHWGFRSWEAEKLATHDAEVTEKVKWRCEHQNYLNWRGKFFRVGFAVDGTMGGAHSTLGAGVNVRLGYFISWINLEIGAKYNYMTSTKVLFGRDADLGGGFFEKQYVSVPVDLHIHLSHDFDYALYLGLGAELGVANLTSAFKEKNPTNNSTTDKEIGSKDITVSPKLSFGWTTKAVELEVFALYDANCLYNKNYVEANYSTLCDEKVYKQQVSDSKFFDKTRFGLALRFLF